MNIFFEYKKIFLAAAAILVALVLPVFFFLDRTSFSDSRVCWTWGPDQASVFPKDKLVQTFTPERDGLRAIVVKPLLENDKFDPAEAEFVFRDKNENVLFSKKVRHFWMENSSMFALDVPLNLFRQGEPYSLEITPLFEKKPGHILGFWKTDGDCFDGSLTVDGKKEKRADLAMTFRYSSGGLSANLETLFQRMAQFKPLWMKSKSAFPILFGALIFGTAILLISLAVSIRDQVSEDHTDFPPRK